jgi:hypothetical protein
MPAVFITGFIFGAIAGGAIAILITGVLLEKKD